MNVVNALFFTYHTHTYTEACMAWRSQCFQPIWGYECMYYFYTSALKNTSAALYHFIWEKLSSCHNTETQRLFAWWKYADTLSWFCYGSGFI